MRAPRGVPSVSTCVRADAVLSLPAAGDSRRDKSRVIRAALRYVRMAPQNATAHYSAASVFAADLSMREMLAHMELAVRLQPEALFFPTRGEPSVSGGRAASTRRSGTCATLLRWSPATDSALHWLGDLRLRRTSRRGARRGPARLRVLSDAADSWRTRLGRGQRRTDRLGTDAVLERLTQAARLRFVAPSGVAAIEMALGRGAAGAARLSRIARGRLGSGVGPRRPAMGASPRSCPERPQRAPRDCHVHADNGTMCRALMHASCSGRLAPPQFRQTPWGWPFLNAPREHGG